MDIQTYLNTTTLAQFAPDLVAFVSRVVPALVFLATCLLLGMKPPVEGGSPGYAALYSLIHIVANFKKPASVVVAPAQASPLPAATLGIILSFVGCCLLAACASQPTPITTAQVTADLNAAASNMQQVNGALCKIDAAEQPVLVPLGSAVATLVVPSSAGAITGSVALDQSLVHPAILTACAAVNGTPIGAVPVASAQPAVTAPAASQAPASTN